MVIVGAKPVADSISTGRSFNFQQLRKATQNFHRDNMIGIDYYKGVLPNKEEITVKQLLIAYILLGEQKFMISNEVGIFSAVNHPNLVKLLGCCTENNQLLVVYEYMENNSLSSALFGTGNLNLKSRLNWQTRFEICLGIAKGLAFLHEEMITHTDIKPTTIQLDNDLNAKISGFGGAVIYRDKDAIAVVCAKKSRKSSYMAPEYAARGHLSYEADVYSFGVVMLEILSGKASTDYRPNDETSFLLDRAYVGAPTMQPGCIVRRCNPPNN